MTPPPNPLYLGRLHSPDAAHRVPFGPPLEALTNHAVIVGMTGSGKTGLGITLIEEALRRNVPTLVIDPKGDMGNLALTFPALDAAHLQPWFDPHRDTDAAAAAVRWTKALRDWNLSPGDAAHLHHHTQTTVFTPGGHTRPLALLGALQAPTAPFDPQTDRDTIDTWVTGLLGLVSLNADPLTSRPYILLTNLIEHAWRHGHDLSLERLLALVQRPPMRTLGVFELDTFYPASERAELTMRIGGLLASPAFSAWLQGPALDIHALMAPNGTHTPCNVLSLAHLSAQEQRFATTVTLSRAVAWMRQQPGTSALRALIYIDEAFGMAPPTAAPSTKRPLMTLIKQARAHGVGIVLATQNPVDLDHKIMGNAGMWFVGRLQTQRDKARVLDAARAAGGPTLVQHIDNLTGTLAPRHFVALQTHHSAPATHFSTRCTLSFLRGPMTQADLALLNASHPQNHAPPPPSTHHNPAPATAALPKDPDPPQLRPQPPEGQRTAWLDPAAPWHKTLNLDPHSTRFEAALAGRVHLHYRDARAGIDHVEEWECVGHPLPEHFDPENGTALGYDARALHDAPPPEASYIAPEAPIHRASWWKSTQASLKRWLRRERSLTIHRNKTLKLYSRVDEPLDAFKARCKRIAEQRADQDIAKERQRIERQLGRLQDQLQSARQKERAAQDKLKSRQREEVVSGASSILGIFLGGRSRLSKMTSGARRATRKRQQVRDQNQRLQAAGDKVDALEQKLLDLEDELQDTALETQVKWAQTALEIEPVEVNISRSGVDIDDMTLVWLPIRLGRP